MVSIALLAGPVIAALIFAQAQAQTPPPKPFEPTVGMAGKDVVWVPSSPQVVEKMLDVAKVTPQDLVMDLGSGDGRMVIAAAKRGARAVGVEFNPDMVALSRLRAKEAGVDTRRRSSRATCTRQTFRRHRSWRCSCSRRTSTS